VEEDQPDLFFTQFVALDSASHKYGPFSAEAISVAAALDRRFAQLLAVLREKRYGVMALADHGQHTVEPPIDGKRGWHDDTTEESMLVPLVWASPDEMLTRP